MYKSLFTLYLALAALFCPLTADVEKVVILGGGPAGFSSAIFSGQAKLNPLVLIGPDCTSQLSIIHSIDNYPGFPEQIPGKELLERFQQQAERFGARVRDSIVVDVDLESRPFTLFLDNGETILTESIILAQGVNKNWLGLEAEEKLRGKGVMGTSLCLKEQYTGKTVAVVGGGHAALQEAIMISEFASNVILINRGNKFNASDYHQDVAFAKENIQIFYDSDVVDILDVTQDKVTGIKIANRTTKETQSFAIDGVVVAIGSTPNSNIFDGKVELTPSGHVVLPNKNTESSVPGVFAAGDVSEVSYGRVAVATGAGAMAALDAIKFLSNQNK